MNNKYSNYLCLAFYFAYLRAISNNSNCNCNDEKGNYTNLQTPSCEYGFRLVVIFQETGRNHFWEAGMLMQSYMLENV